jgi:translation elongation factor EF-1alpha
MDVEYLNAHVNLKLISNSTALIGPLSCGKSTILGQFLLKNSENTFNFEEILNETEILGQNLFSSLTYKSKDEKLRQITLEFKQFLITTQKYNLYIIDTPGNKKFIKNTIRGISMMESCILVISPEINKNNLQLYEDLKQKVLIAHTLGIKQLIVVINKMDLVNFSQKIYEKIKNSLSQILIQIGFDQNLINFIPVCAKNNYDENNINIKSQNYFSWYEGECLLNL